MDQLEMIQYTDPMCIWCYAMEPAVRKLQVVLGKQLQYRNVCGLLVSDVRQVIGDDAYSNLRFEQLKMQVNNPPLNGSAVKWGLEKALVV